MATPSTTPFPLTGNNFIDVSLSRYVWHPGPGRIIHWPLSDGFSGEYWINPSVAASGVKDAFDFISNYINIEFVYVGYFDDPRAAYRAGSDINLAWDGAIVFDDPNTWAIGLFPDSAFNDIYYPGAPGDVFFNLNSAANALPSYGPGSTGFFVLLHELGHALGLKHTHDDGGTGGPTLSELGFGQLDVDWLSIMSYEDDYQWNLLSWEPATPMALDVLGLQYLYGKNESNHAGDSIHELRESGAYATLWDSSGFDILSFATSNTGWTIIMEEPSSVGEILGFAFPIHDTFRDSPTSLWWLLGEYEAVVGSAYGDFISGNELSNVFLGAGGNDVILGGVGSGLDVAGYQSNIRENSVESSVISLDGNNLHGFRVIGPEGVDELIGIERLVFSLTNNPALYALDIGVGEVGGQAYRLYQAAFGRTPDKAGLGYWINRMDDGLDLVEVSARFIDSNEFRKLYGEDPENEEFLTALYRNVLKRGPDNDGYAWWLDQLDNNPARTWDKVLTEFSESSENYAAVLPAIENGFEYIQPNTATVTPPEFDFLIA